MAESDTVYDRVQFLLDAPSEGAIPMLQAAFARPGFTPSRSEALRILLRLARERIAGGQLPL